MYIKTAVDLGRLDVYAQGRELSTIMGMDMKDGKRINHPMEELVHVHTFTDPVLVTDSHRIGQLPPVLRDTLFALFGSQTRTVEYDGVSVTCDSRHTGVWSPSIDTLLFARVLNRLRLQPKVAIEIGCGSGFLSKYLLEKTGVEAMYINDLDRRAVQCAMDNITDDRKLIIEGDGLEHLKKRKYDLIICNPPYIPRPRSIDDNPYEGVHVLHYLIHEGRKHLNAGGRIITNISSLAADVVLGDALGSISDAIVDTLAVPLKVYNVLNNAEWMSYLHQRGLKKELRNGYEYWQTLHIVQIQYSRGVYTECM